MKIICSGYQKTGTKSLATALRLLGYNVYDFEEQFFFIGRDLSRIFENGWTVKDLRRIYEKVDVIIDLPSCILWEQLHEAFPDAKIIHTERDSAEVWIKSLMKQVQSVQTERLGRLISALTPTGLRFAALFALAMRMQVSSPPMYAWWFNNINEQVAMLRYREHNSHVKLVAPESQTLFFKVSEGWGPLCQFLDKPIPDTAFPHKNKGGAVTKEVLNNSLLFKQVRKEILIETFLFVLSLFLIRKFALKFKGNETVTRTLHFFHGLFRKMIGVKLH